MNIKKYEDPDILEAIKEWALSSGRMPASALSKELSYADFNKFAQKLLDVGKAKPEEVEETIYREAQWLEENRNVSRKGFRKIADYVYEVGSYNKTIGLSLISFGLGVGESSPWQRLGKLGSMSVTDEVAKELPKLRDEILKLQAVVKQSRLELVLSAAMLIYYAREFSHEFGEGAWKEDICFPVLESANLPKSISSISRYATGFEKLAVLLTGQSEKVSIASPQFSSWWYRLVEALQERLVGGVESFKDIRSSVEALPGVQGVFPYVEASAQKEPKSKLTIEDDIKRFSGLSEAKQKAEFNKRLKALKREAEFFKLLREQRLLQTTQEVALQLQSTLDLCQDFSFEK